MQIGIGVGIGIGVRGGGVAPPQYAAGGAITVLGAPALIQTATGHCVLIGTPSAGNTLTVGGKTYTFVVSASGANQISINLSDAVTFGNIVIAINNDNDTTLCTSDGSGALNANTAGAAGNSIALSTNEPNIQLTPFHDGVDADTLTVGSKTATLVRGHPSGDEVIGDTDYITTWINDNTADCQCTAIIDAETSNIILTANEIGTGGNSIPLSTNSEAITLTPFSGGTD